MNAAAALDITIIEADLARKGEIGAHMAPLLSDAVTRRGEARVVLDTAEVDFIDGRAIQPANPSTRVSHPLEISSIDDDSNVGE